MAGKVRITQITSAQWEGKGGMGFSVFGLGEDQNVYRWLKSEGKWSLFKTPVEYVGGYKKVQADDDIPF